MRTPHYSSSPSFVTKLGTLALALGAHQALPSSAEAEQITTVTHEKAAVCFGSDYVGDYSMERMNLTSTTTVAKTDLALTKNEKKPNTTEISGLAADKYTTRLFRNYVYAKKGTSWLMYDIDATEESSTKMSVSKGTIPTFNPKEDDVFFIEAPSFDQDKLLIISPKKIEVYTPFKSDGKVKPEFKNGPAVPVSTLIPAASILSAKVQGNMIYAQEDAGGKKQLTTYKLEGDTVKMVGVPIPLSDDMESWTQAKKVFVTIGDGKSKTMYLFMRDTKTDTLILRDTADLTKVKSLPKVQDITTVDPEEGKYQFQSLSSGKTVVLDSVTGITKDVLPQTVYPLNGYVSWLPAYSKPTWLVLDKQKHKAYLVELTNAATLETKVTETDFKLFQDEYMPSFGTGGGDCVNNPNVTGKVTVTGTPEPPPEAVEPSPDGDAESTEVDGGGTDVAAEVVIPPPDAIDAWLDGEVEDMGDIFKEAGGDDAAPDVPVPPPDGTPDTLDQTDVPEGSGSDADAAIDAWLDGNGDIQDIFNGEVDGVVVSPDMSKNDVTVKPEAEPDTAAAKDNATSAATDNGSGSSDAGRNPGVDGITSNDGKNNPPVAKPPVKPSQPDCNAGPDGNPNSAFPFALAAIGLTFTRVRRRVEAVMRWLAEK